ncbi:MAG: ATP-binding protein [Bacteroidales bacterium]|nr:ATP-binding protein [Bacteroidales bacterium]
MIFEEMQLKIPSSPENVYLVERFIEEICDRYNISNHYFGNITIAVLEAVDNAIVHGNKNNPIKEIGIKFKAEPGKLSFTIKDEGQGFDFQSVIDPTDISYSDENNVGRGIFIIKSLADKVVFNEKGNEVEITYGIKGISKELASQRKKKLEEYSKEAKKRQKKA